MATAYASATGNISTMTWYADSTAPSVATSLSPRNYWKLNDVSGTSAVDTGSSPSNGTYVGTPTLAATGGYAGVAGQCVTLNGTSQYVNLTTLGSFGSGFLATGLSIQFRIRTTSTSIATMVGTQLPGSPNKMALILRCNTSDAANYSAGRLRISLSDNSATAKLLIASVNTDTGLRDGNWHTLTVTIEPATNTISVFIDGSAVTTTYVYQQSPDTFANFTQAVFVGALNTNGTADQFFGGSIQDLQFFSRVLSLAEHQSYHNAATTLPSTIVPTSSDSLDANGYTVTIDSNVTATQLQNTAGGYFNIVGNSNFTINADIRNTCTLNSGNNCVYAPPIWGGNSSGGTLVVNGNIYGGNAGNGSAEHCGMLIWTTMTVTVTGNIVGGSVTFGHALRGQYNYAGSWTIYGNVTGGTGSSAHGISMNNGNHPSITVNGTVSGGTGAVGITSGTSVLGSNLSPITINGNINAGGISYGGIATVTINGNLIPTTSVAAELTGTGTMIVNGTAFGSSAPGLRNTNATGICSVRNIQFGPNGENPVAGRIRLISQSAYSATANVANVLLTGGSTTNWYTPKAGA